MAIENNGEQNHVERIFELSKSEDAIGSLLSKIKANRSAKVHQVFYNIEADKFVLDGNPGKTLWCFNLADSNLRVVDPLNIKLLKDKFKSSARKIAQIHIGGDLSELPHVELRKPSYALANGYILDLEVSDSEVWRILMETKTDDEDMMHLITKTDAVNERVQNMRFLDLIQAMGYSKSLVTNISSGKEVNYVDYLEMTEPLGRLSYLLKNGYLSRKALEQCLRRDDFYTTFYPAMFALTEKMHHQGYYIYWYGMQALAKCAGLKQMKAGDPELAQIIKKI